MSENNWERDVLEKLMLQTLKEQRVRRRWGIFFKLTTIFLVIFVIASIKNLFLTESDGTPVQAPYGHDRNQGNHRSVRKRFCREHHQGSEQGL